jgi:hypothetical protein
MQDKPVVRMVLKFRGNVIFNRALYGVDISAGANARAVADTENMGVNGLRGHVKPHVQHHIRRFAPHAGQGLQRGTA